MLVLRLEANFSKSTPNNINSETNGFITEAENLSRRREFENYRLQYEKIGCRECLERTTHILAT